MLTSLLMDRVVWNNDPIVNHSIYGAIFNGLLINATYNSKMRKGFVVLFTLLLLIATTSALHIFLVDEIRVKAVPEDD